MLRYSRRCNSALQQTLYAGSPRPPAHPLVGKHLRGLLPDGRSDLVLRPVHSNLAGASQSGKIGVKIFSRTLRDGRVMTTRFETLATSPYMSLSSRIKVLRTFVVSTYYIDGDPPGLIEMDTEYSVVAQWPWSI